MHRDTFKEFKRKRVLILGLGLHGGGAGAASFFARAGAVVTVTDLKSKAELAPTIKALKRFSNISYVLGRHRSQDIVNADFIVKNPGVPDDSPWLKIARAHCIPVLSDIEVFFKFSPAQIIGITGTKGKSTTAQLLAEILRSGGKKRGKKRVWLAGNIRKSALAILPKIHRGDIVVLELSSFQLDSLASSKMSPHIAMVTNIFPDHLNRYRNFRHYANSKAMIFRFQKKRDYLFLPKGDRFLKKLSDSARSQRIFVDAVKTLRPFRALTATKFFPHMASSLALAVAVGRRFGVNASAVRKSLKNFRPLSGRLETVRKVRGITFVNDTTATNPGAAEAALRALRSWTKGIVLIAGGSDKKLPSLEFAKAILKFTKAVVFLPGQGTEIIKAELKRLKAKGSIRDAKTMVEAVRMAYGLAKSGDTVLLSPGAASFGLFQHEFDRGEQFVRAANGLK